MLKSFIKPFILVANNKPEKRLACMHFDLTLVSRVASVRAEKAVCLSLTVGIYLSRPQNNVSSRLPWIISRFDHQTAKHYLHDSAMGLTGAAWRGEGGLNFPFRPNGVF